MGKWYTIAVLCPVLLAFIAFYALDMYIMCGSDMIGDVCQLYEQKAVVGSLCYDLCDSKTIATTKCMSSSPEKIVFQATWNNKEIILKYDTNSANIYSYDHLKEENDFKSEIASAVNLLFGECKNCSTLTSKLIHIADVNNDGQLSFIETRTILQLLRSPEPAMLLVLNGSQVSLNLYGYCGHLYAVEKLAVIADTVYGLEIHFQDLAALPNLFEPFENLVKQIAGNIATFIGSFKIIQNNIYPLMHRFKSVVTKYCFMSRVPSIEERFSFIKDSLDGIFDLSNNSYGLVQTCDAHLGNFGISYNKEFKVLDYDLVFPQHYLQQLLSSKHCWQDVDCRIGDFDECTSICNKTTGFCSKILNSQMLKTICTTSFPLIFRNIYMDFTDGNETELICLENAVKKIGFYCMNIPLANNITQLYSQIEDVKEKLFNVTERNYYCNL